ncbi:MAG: flagellar assembly protein FliH [Gammaproteobacteria bacterium]|nr:flagellar assembly protein FliH [Gammaproteobacteria bacterium]MCK5091699.1 flagellar assembly protein FliH [Gammaproteobacteria bacterium]
MKGKPGSRVITRESLENYKEWNTPSVGSDNKDGVVKITARNPHMLTANQVEKVQKQAYDEAYAAGMKEGLEAGKQEAISRVKNLEQLMQSLAQPFQQLDQEVEDELVTLAIAIVRQLVRREIKTDPGQVVAVVREAVAALPVVSRNIRLHLHPEDAVIVQEALSLSESERAWAVIEDPSINRGGCRVISENSQVDATLEARLAQIIASVFGGERVSDESKLDDTETDSSADKNTE